MFSALNFFIALPVFAHHSGSAYDLEHPINLKGVVTSVEWTNPHVFIYVNIKDDAGAIAEWRVEGNSPNMLTRVGWKKNMIKPGDTILFTGAQAKTGTKVLRLISMTMPDGRKFDGQGFK